MNPKVEAKLLRRLSASRSRGVPWSVALTLAAPGLPSLLQADLRAAATRIEAGESPADAFRKMEELGGGLKEFLALATLVRGSSPYLSRMASLYEAEARAASVKKTDRRLAAVRRSLLLTLGAGAAGGVGVLAHRRGYFF